MRTVNSGINQKMGDPAFERIEGECLTFSNQKIDLGLKGTHILMYERCHEIIFFSHFKSERVMSRMDMQI